MQLRERDSLIRSIYDAALDPAEWPAMLTRVARAMNCEQCNFVMVDPYAGDTQVITPMWREDDRESFFSHWQKEFTIAHKLQAFPVGRVIDYEEMFDVGWLRRTDFYNEWWLPQGVGGGSFAANIVADGQATASITVHAPTAKLGFTHAEKELFQDIVGHLTRSVKVLRRLQMARLVTTQTEAELASGFAVVDRYGLVLHADAPTRSWLERLGIIQLGSNATRIAPGPVKSQMLRAIDDAVGSHCDLRDQTGSPVRLTIIPCSPCENLDLVSIDRPAALIWLASPEQIYQEKMRRLSTTYSLTPAETRIALEACSGGGRVEIAKRCGLSPSTVRTHLEAIYLKTDVHKHAELVHLVETA